MWIVVRRENYVNAFPLSGIFIGKRGDKCYLALDSPASPHMQASAEIVEFDTWEEAEKVMKRIVEALESGSKVYWISFQGKQGSGN